MSSHVRGIESLVGDVARMRGRAGRPHKPLKDAAALTGTSIRRNFEVGGRPRWKPHAESTRRRTHGPSRLLRRGDDLMDSFKPFVRGRSAGQKSPSVYGPRQNFGYPGGPGRGHSRTPAREFALFQREDERRIGGLFLDHVTR